MIKKIRLENFLAHGSTEFELDSGVTVLTGPNNSGKSSIVEALRCIATNPLPKNFIRHGAKKARVELELEDGIRVAWVRTKAYALYEVYTPGEDEPQVYAKFGRKPPEDVLNLIRLNMVPLESGNSLDVHIGNQRSPIFLLDQSPGVAAQFFAASSEAAHLLAMQTELKTKVRDFNRDRKRIAHRLSGIADELDSYESLPDVNLELETARELKEAIEATGSVIPRMEGLILKFEEISSAKKRLTIKAELLNKITAAPQLFDTAALSGTLAGLNMVTERLEKENSKSCALKNVSSPPELYDSKKISSTIAESRRLSRHIQILKHRKQRLDSLSAPPETFDASAISATLRKLNDACLFKDRVERRSMALKSIPEPPVLFDLSGLKLSKTRIDEMRSLVSSEQVKADKIKQNIADMASRIKERLEHEGQCPLCGAEFDAERFMGAE